jgi:hypothetical protein
MKKIYNQPTVSTVNLMGGSVMQASSPGALVNSGSGTGSIGSGDPITGN